jgi:hypothetical protein
MDTPDNGTNRVAELLRGTLQTQRMGSGDNEDDVNPVALRRRSLEESMDYLARKYPNYSFGVMFKEGDWYAMCEDITYRITPDQFLTGMALAVATVATRVTELSPSE